MFSTELAFSSVLTGVFFGLMYVTLRRQITHLLSRPFAVAFIQPYAARVLCQGVAGSHVNSIHSSTAQVRWPPLQLAHFDRKRAIGSDETPGVAPWKRVPPKGADNAFTKVTWW